MGTLLNYKGAFIDHVLVNKRAAQFKEKVNSFLKIYLNCFSRMGGTQKNKWKKRVEIRAF